MNTALRGYGILIPYSHGVAKIVACTLVVWEQGDDDAIFLAKLEQKASFMATYSIEPFASAMIVQASLQLSLTMSVPRPHAYPDLPSKLL